MHEKVQDKPFITVVIRTQGTRLVQLREALLCLATQTFSNFEALLVCHTKNSRTVATLEHELESFPKEFASKVRVIHAEGGSRATPLNLGLSEGRGDYFTFFDDDDYVFSNWLEIFHDLSTEGGGRVLRSQALVQTHLKYQDSFFSYSKHLNEPWAQYSPRFSLIDHLLENQSPFMTLAFPRSLVDQHGLTFDESLTTTEDWDFLLRAAILLGVENSEKLTCIYRKWINLSNSSEIPGYEWEANRLTLLSRINQAEIRLPPGEILTLESIFSIKKEVKAPVERTVEVQRCPDHEPLRTLIAAIESRSWRWTAPARAVVSAIKMRKRLSLQLINIEDERQVKQLLGLIHGSIWWKITKPLRKRK